MTVQLPFHAPLIDSATGMVNRMSPWVKILQGLSTANVAPATVVAPSNISPAVASVISQTIFITNNAANTAVTNLLVPNQVYIHQFISLNAAVTAIGTTPTNLIIDAATTVTSNLTVPSTLGITVLPELGTITKTVGTLTINGSFSGGLSTIFIGFNAGDVTFGPASVDKVFPQWWGAKGNGKLSSGASMASNSTTVVLPTAVNSDGFTSTDVNKSILVSGTSSNDVVDLWGTITAVTDSLDATISLPAPSGGLTSCKVYWWTTGQDDAIAIQSALQAASHVHMPAGAYVVTGTNTPLLYSQQLREWSGDGPGRTVILSSSNNLGGRLVRFLDANYLYIHDMSSRGPGINGVYGGHWVFDLVSQSNIERVDMERVEVDHTASTDAIYFNTPILCTFNQVKALLNVGNGIHLFDAVSCSLNQVYSITNVSSAFLIEGSTDVVINGGAAESSGMGIHVLNSTNVQINGTDTEAQVHRSPDAPTSFPAPSVVAGGSIPVGTYYLKYTWVRQYVGPAVYFESLPSPESTLITLTAGNQSIRFTIPIPPTDVPNIYRANIYVTATNGASGTETYGDFWNVTAGQSRTVTETSFTTTSITPPTLAGVGHGIVIDGGARNAVRECHSRSLGSNTSRHLLVTGSAVMTEVTNLDIGSGGPTPDYNIELQAGVVGVNLSANVANSTILNNATEVSMRTSDLRNIGGPGVLTLFDANTTRTLEQLAVYPSAGVGNSTGSAWGTSYTVGTAANNLVQMTAATKLPAVDGSLLTGLVQAQISGLTTANSPTFAGLTIDTNTISVDSVNHRVGVGVTAPLAALHLKAGTASANTSPLKLTSGINLTTAEAGAMEYNGTNLFFTRTGTTRENILVGNANANAPSTSVGVAIVNFYGSSATNFLGTPNSWASVVIGGTTYKMPLYT